jgi:hypothetical protein
MDRDRFRETLRELRKARVGSQGELSARTARDDAPPVNVMTISDIERGTVADPGLWTVVRLVEAIPDLTVSAFFAQIEGLSAQQPPVENQRSPEPSDKGVSDERPSPVQLPFDPDSMGAAMAVIKYLTGELIRTRADAEVRRPPPGHRADTPDRPRSRVPRAARDRGRTPGKNRRKR